MTLLITFIVILVLIDILLFYTSINCKYGLQPLYLVIFIFSVSSTFACTFATHRYIAAGNKADILNREYNTNYTQTEVYFANDIIDTIQQIKRKRIDCT